jgi:hypothetical protein
MEVMGVVTPLPQQEALVEEAMEVGRMRPQVAVLAARLEEITMQVLGVVLVAQGRGLLVRAVAVAVVAGLLQAVLEEQAATA